MRAQILTMNTTTVQPATDFDPFDDFEDFEDPFGSDEKSEEVVSEDAGDEFDDPFEDDFVSEETAKTDNTANSAPTQNAEAEIAGTSEDAKKSSAQAKPQLHADNQDEKWLLDYFTANASEALKAKTLAGKKTIQGAFKYIYNEAKNQAAKGANCAMVDDATVYGWMMHYFEEDSLDCEAKPVVPKPATVKTAATKKKENAKPEAKAEAKPDPKTDAKPTNDADEELDIFSLFGGE